jgi:hypothetical protein
MEKFKYTSLVLVVIGIGLLHFFTPGHLVFYHDTYRRLSYFPIALGGIWYGVWGGVSLALLTSIAFIPHLLIFFGEEPATYLSELTEIQTLGRKIAKILPTFACANGAFGRSRGTAACQP